MHCLSVPPHGVKVCCHLALNAALNQAHRQPLLRQDVQRVAQVRRPWPREPRLNPPHALEALEVAFQRREGDVPRGAPLDRGTRRGEGGVVGAAGRAALRRWQARRVFRNVQFAGSAEADAQCDLLGAHLRQNSVKMSAEIMQ